jgi:hypothetical protein
MDDEHVEELVRIGGEPDGLARARAIAAKALADAGLPPFPHNACAATLSAMLQLSGIDVKMSLGAGKLAYMLGGVGASSRHWVHILVGDQKPGDVGVTFDEDPSIPGADHIYRVVERIDADVMIVADNQGRVSTGGMRAAKARRRRLKVRSATGVRTRAGPRAAPSGRYMKAPMATEGCAGGHRRDAWRSASLQGTASVYACGCYPSNYLTQGASKLIQISVVYG